MEFCHEDKRSCRRINRQRAITRNTYEIIERNKDLDKIILAGIKTRGVFYRFTASKSALEQLKHPVPVVELDQTLP